METELPGDLKEIVEEDNAAFTQEMDDYDTKKELEKLREVRASPHCQLAGWVGEWVS